MHTQVYTHLKGIAAAKGLILDWQWRELKVTLPPHTPAISGARLKVVNKPVKQEKWVAVIELTVSREQAQQCLFNCIISKVTRQLNNAIKYINCAITSSQTCKLPYVNKCCNLTHVVYVGVRTVRQELSNMFERINTTRKRQKYSQAVRLAQLTHCCCKWHYVQRQRLCSIHPRRELAQGRLLLHSQRSCSHWRPVAAVRTSKMWRGWWPAPLEEQTMIHWPCIQNWAGESQAEGRDGMERRNVRFTIDSSACTYLSLCETCRHRHTAQSPLHNFKVLPMSNNRAFI